MFLACKTYDKQLTIEKMGLSHQAWSHEGSTFKKKVTRKAHFPRPGESDPFVVVPNISAVTKFCKVLVPFRSVVIEDTVKFDVFNIKKYKV